MTGYHNERAAAKFKKKREAHHHSWQLVMGIIILSQDQDTKNVLSKLSVPPLAMTCQEEHTHTHTHTHTDTHTHTHTILHLHTLEDKRAHLRTGPIQTQHLSLVPHDGIQWHLATASVPHPHSAVIATRGQLVFPGGPPAHRHHPALVRDQERLNSRARCGARSEIM